MLEIKYTNEYSEILHIKYDNVSKKIMFNHSDIHEKDEYESIEKNIYIYF